MTVMDVIRRRRSVRRYSPKSIPEDVFSELLEALRLAPSACNFQPWRFIVVSDAGTRRALAVASHNQKFIAEAPVILVGVGLPAEGYKHMGGKGSSVEVDVAIALDHLTLAAAEKGLGTCWIGAFDEAEVKRILGVPAGAKVVALTPVGYPAEPDLLHAENPPRRKPIESVIARERFG